MTHDNVVRLVVHIEKRNEMKMRINKGFKLRREGDLLYFSSKYMANGSERYSAFVCGVFEIKEYWQYKIRRDHLVDTILRDYPEVQKEIRNVLDIQENKTITV